MKTQFVVMILAATCTYDRDILCHLTRSVVALTRMFTEAEGKRFDHCYKRLGIESYTSIKCLFC